MKTGIARMLFIHKAVYLFLFFSGTKVMAQQKNFIDQPYLEVSGSADTLITPDQIFLNIALSERDTKDRITIEQLERNMLNALQKLGINSELDLKVIDVVSNYRDYLLKKTDILKSKRYELEVSTADTAANVLIELEKLGISNIHVARLDHTRKKEFEQQMRERSVLDARRKASGIVSVLNQKVGPAIHIVEAGIGGVPDSQNELSEVVVMGYSNKSRSSTVEIKDVSFRPIKIQKAVLVKFILE